MVPSGTGVAMAIAGDGNPATITAATVTATAEDSQPDSVRRRAAWIFSFIKRPFPVGAVAYRALPFAREALVYRCRILRRKFRAPTMSKARRGININAFHG